MELGLFVLAIVAITGLATFSVYQYVRFRKAVERIAQIEIDKITLQAQLAKLHQELENYKLGETEEFIQFLSKSRQWSFDFIESFQGSLDELFTLLDNSPEDTQSILSKFIELKQYLPEKEITKENSNE